MKRILPWIFAGLLIRLVLIPITLHSDIRDLNLAAYIISQKGSVFGFYDYLAGLPMGHELYRSHMGAAFTYPPLAFLSLGFWMKIFYPLYAGTLFFQVIKDTTGIVFSGQLAKILYLIKGQFLVYDALILVFLGKLFSDKRKADLARIIWLINPVTIYATYMVGQLDILVALSVVASLYFAKTRRFVLSSVALGLGATVKLFPLFLLPLLVLYSHEDVRGRIKVLLSGVGVYLAVILPYLPSVGFRRFSLMATQTDKIFFAKLPVGGAESIPIFLLAIFVLYLVAYRSAKRLPLWGWYLSLMLIFFSVVHYHVQWFIWIVPLIAIWLAEKFRERLFLSLVLLASYIFVVFGFDNSLNIGLFSIVNPALSNISVVDSIARFYDPDILLSVVRAVFASVSIYIIYDLIKYAKA